MSCFLYFPFLVRLLLQISLPILFGLLLRCTPHSRTASASLNPPVQCHPQTLSGMDWSPERFQWLWSSGWAGPALQVPPIAGGAQSAVA